MLEKRNSGTPKQANSSVENGKNSIETNVKGERAC
jgi:hypothetical protein